MLSFVTPIAYDFHYAFEVIHSYYEIADEIILGLDCERMSFSQKKFPFNDMEFYEGLQKIDPLKKIRIIEENFHVHTEPMANEHAERQRLTQSTKKDNWIIQIDSDEVLLNPQEFVNWIKDIPQNKSIRARWITVYKRFADTFLVINDNQPYISIGSKSAKNFISNRDTNLDPADSPLMLLHHAYGRTREEVHMKLSHWGHSKEINLEHMLTTWDMANLDTYPFFRNFHPLYPPFWPSLVPIQIKREDQTG